MNRLIIVLLFVVGTQSAFGQGALSPTAAPAPTMKSLAQVEPRTPISALPATITASGSYYITTNLTGIAGGTNGVTILASDVTLDLCGFTLLGVGGSGAGIYVPNSESNLAIHNGVVDSWGDNGLSTFNAYNSQFERLRVSNCGGDGLDTGSNCVVLVCTASGNDEGRGIVAANNCSVIDCNANGNDSYGITVGGGCTVKDCNAGGNGVGINVGAGCTVKDCTADGNSFDGISVSGNNCQIAGNTCIVNDYYGIYIFGNQNRVDGNTVADNTQYGVLPSSANVTNSITRNFATGNGTANYGNYAGNNDYAPTGSVNNASVSPWANF
jgi:parallel beta-helix repeat protein